MNTAPVGLCGVLTSTTLVRSENAARSSSGSKPKWAAAAGPRAASPRPARPSPRRSRSRAGRRPPRRPGRTVRAPPPRSPRSPPSVTSTSRWVHGEAVEAPLMRGHRLAQRRDADARRVLVDPAGDVGGGVGEQRRRAVGVGEALPEVDRPGAQGQRRHLGEDRGRVGLHPLDEHARNRTVRRAPSCRRGDVPQHRRHRSDLTPPATAASAPPADRAVGAPRVVTRWKPIRSSVCSIRGRAIRSAGPVCGSSSRSGAACSPPG